jgi:hypothetical protein
MLVKNVRDDEGKTFAVPDHILEDFEIDQEISKPARFGGNGHKLSDNGNGRNGSLLGGWDSALSDLDHGSQMRANGAVHSSNGNALNALSAFLRATQIDCTLGSLVPALGLRSILGDSTETIHSDTLFMGGYSDDFGTRTGDDNYEVHQILQLLENPAIGNLPVNVTLADIYQLKARLAQ